MRFLVTAGNTREFIDSVRWWSNIFTGNTGLAIARGLAEIGAVDLLTSNTSHLAEVKYDPRIAPHGFVTHSELRESLATKLRQANYDAIFMTAAVSDYRPTRVFAVASRQKHADGEQWIVKDAQAGKIKSNHDTIAVLGEQTEKLVDLFRSEWNHRGLLVKFKLEVGISADELIRIGQASRRHSGAEFLVANTLEMTQGPDAGAFLLSDAGHEWIPRSELPQRMVRLAQTHS